MQSVIVVPRGPLLSTSGGAERGSDSSRPFGGVGGGMPTTYAIRGPRTPLRSQEGWRRFARPRFLRALPGIM